MNSTVTVHQTKHPQHVSRQTPCLILLLEGDRPQELGERWELADVEAVRISRGKQRDCTVNDEGGRSCKHITIPDQRMSSQHVRIERIVGGWKLYDIGSKNGTLVNGTLTRETKLRDGDLVSCGYSVFRFREAMAAISPEASDSAIPAELRTFHGDLHRVFTRALAIAKSDISVLILGETGTGKEVVARAIHKHSGRNGAFVPINCGALPDQLVESELFGHRKGAFSGATEESQGLVRAADQGTLLLDEIGDLPMMAQTAFLRILQEQEVTPIGATKSTRVDIRVISATHKDISKMVERGEFRADLYSRINGFRLELPPLHERPDDLGILIPLLAKKISEEAGRPYPRLTEEAVRALAQHDWPFNVRELEKCLRAGFALCSGDTMGFEQLKELLPTADEPMSAAELRERLVALLQEHQGNVSAVARAMGKARMQIHRWLKRFDLSIDQFRADAGTTPPPAEPSN